MIERGDHTVQKPKQPALDLWDVVIEVLRSTNSAITPTHRASGNRCETGNHSRNTLKPKQKGNRDVEQLSHVDHVPTHTFFSMRVSVVHLWRQRSSDQNDHQRQKSNDETRVKNAQSCA